MTERLQFIAIEGGDGSGKGTQTKLLTAQLEASGRAVMSLSFPRYGKHSAKTVEQYLRGEFGAANNVAPELASAAFALDRVAASFDINTFREEHPDGIIITDRYVGSNLAHQATKIADEEARHRFYRDSLALEYDDLRLPRPDINIVLLVPSNTAQANVDKKEARSYTTAKRDIHEADADHLNKALRNYQELCELFPDEFTAIWAIDKTTNAMLPVDDINLKIRHIGGL